MGCVARGVHEEKGKVIGILPEFFHTKDIGYLDKDMRERKAKMDERSDAFIVLLGGVGTLEEAMEILSMRQLELTDKLLVFINTQGFYDKLNDTFDAMVGQNFAKENKRFHIHLDVATYYAFQNDYAVWSALLLFI